MKFDGLTEDCKSALVIAQQEAQRLGYTLIEPEHLLLGIISDPSSIASRVLREQGVTPERLREAVEAEARSGVEVSVARISPQAKEAITLAAGEMSRLRQRSLSSAHLLLGILDLEKADALRILKSLGVSLWLVRGKVRRMQRKATPTQGLSTSLPSSLTQPGEDKPGTSPAPQQSANVPAGGPVLLDDASQRLAVRLARARQRARSIYIIIVGAIVALLSILIFQVPQLFWSIGLLVITLINTPVLNWQPVAGWSPLLVTLWLLLASVFLLLLTVPFAWYTNNYLPRRYTVSKGTTRQWFRLFGSALLLVWGQGWLLVEVITLLLAVQPQTWWIWAALAQFLYSVLVSRSGWLRFLLYRGDIQPLTEGEIAERFQALRQRLHLPSCRLFQFKISHRTGAVNAFFIGWGSGRRVLLTDTMLQSFSPDEIEVVLAHELGHLVYHDIWTRLVMRGLSFLGFFYLLDLYMNSFDTTPGESDRALLLLLVIFVLLLAFSLLATRYRRYQEYRADEFALQTTGKIQAFKDAMTRLTNMNMLVATSTRRARHPTSHPTLLKRLKHADEYAARNAAPAGSIQA